jgi:hypothetical protein
MKREGVIVEKIFLLMLGVIILSAVFVFAAQQVYISDGSVSYNISEDVTNLYNITVNISADYENITQVMVILPNNFTFDAGTNGTKVSTISNFTNTSTILTWQNLSAQFLANNTINNVTFWFNATSLYPGAYNFTINVSNQTATTSSHINITINDTTAPTGTISCTPSSPTTADTMTCSCDGSDEVGNVSTVITTSDWPVTRGDHTISCIITDNAGNNYQANTSYSVSEASGIGTNNGGSVTWDKTYVPSKEELIIGYNLEVKKDERVKARVGTNYHYIGIIKLTSTTANISVQSTPQERVFNIGDEKKFDVLDDGFYDLLIKLNSISNNQANLTVTTIHEEISPTVIDGESGEAIIDSEGETNEDTNGEGGNLDWLWVLIIIIVLVLVGVGIWYKKKRESFN